MITALNVDVFTLIFSHIPDFEVLCTTATAIETSEPLQCQGHSTPSVPSAKVVIVGIANYPRKG